MPFLYIEDTDYVARICTLLQQSPFLNIDIHSLLVIKFEVPMGIFVEDLYSLLTSATKGQITALCTLNKDTNNQIARRHLLIHLYKRDHYQLVGSILGLFIDSENRKIFS